ncbi:MAG: SMC-Scp complex subunit ScpB [Candidatus Komeilibacteria bacterium]|nr:SMC-Scp complex subunit ScpB [Candidatus Komeilibacteria bacterium]
MDKNKTVIQLESLLLVASKPLGLKKLQSLLGAKSEELKEALFVLQDRYNRPDSGVRILLNNDAVQLATSPEASELVKDFLKDETTGELTRPSLETLTIIAYRQPVTKAELEQIRGVNCSLILRNLMIRGLVESWEDKKLLTTYYGVTHEFLRFLGINSAAELPDFEKLNNLDHLQKLFSTGEDGESIAFSDQTPADIASDSGLTGNVLGDETDASTENDDKIEDDNDDSGNDDDNDEEGELKVNIYR